MTSYFQDGGQDVISPIEPAACDVNGSLCDTVHTRPYIRSLTLYIQRQYTVAERNFTNFTERHCSDCPVADPEGDEGMHIIGLPSLNGGH